MKKLLTIFLTFMLIAAPAAAIELDGSIDDEIRRNYNPSKLELEALPPLPKNAEPTKTPTTSTAPAASTTPKTSTSVPQNPPAAYTSAAAIKIPAGTKFPVRSNNQLTDRIPKGSKVSFTSTQMVTKTYVSIPHGTVFNAVVMDSHPPQLTGNGGLLVIKADTMRFQGREHRINASITKANNKKVFLNNIKGKRQYLKGMADSTKPGRDFYGKMARATGHLAQDSLTVLLTPFTVIAGVVVLGVNVVGSPVLGLFAKGGNLAIPAGYDFEFKLLDDLYIGN